MIQKAANDNIKWSGRGRRPQTPDLILSGRADEASSWKERDLYVEHDCKFGNVKREYPTDEDSRLSVDGSVIEFRTFRYDRSDTPREGKPIFCAVLPEEITFHPERVLTWKIEWFWSEEDAFSRMDRRRMHIKKILRAAA